MNLTAISRFSWRGRTFEIGDPIDCPDEIVGKRLISEGNAQQGPAAITPIQMTTETVSEAEISKETPVVKKKKNSKKKIR